jgi:anti-anti-sigma factor
VRPTLELSPLIGKAGIKLVGEVDLATAPQLNQALANIWTESEVHLELSDLTFMDSSGVSAILAFAKARNGAGPLVLVNPTAEIERLLELTGLEQHPKVEVRHTRSAADAFEPELLAARHERRWPRSTSVECELASSALRAERH